MEFDKRELTQQLDKSLGKTIINMISEKGAQELTNKLTNIVQKSAFDKLAQEPVLVSDAPEESKGSPLPAQAKLPLLSRPGNQHSPSSPSKQGVKLPPIAKPSVIAKAAAGVVADAFKPAPMPKPPNNQGFIQYGDIISLTARGAGFAGLIIGDGVTHNELECISKDALTHPESSFQIRQVLFRIDPPIEYCDTRRKAQTLPKEPPKAVQAPKEDGLQILIPGKSQVQPQVMEESSKLPANQVNQASQKKHIEEIETFSGQKVSFGQRIQLTHINSQSYLTCSDSVGHAPGSLKVKLNATGNEYSWVELLPLDKLRMLGEYVRYSDAFYLAITKDKNRQFLHVEYVLNRKYELSASAEQTEWYAQRFSSYAQLNLNQEYIVTGNCMRVYNPQLEGYLSVLPRSVKDLVPAEFYQEDDALSPTIGQSMELANTAVVFEKKKTSLSLWEIERQDPFEGGPVRWKEPYRLKNVATGKLITASEEELSTLRLSAEGDKESTLFTLIPESSETERVSFRSLVIFESQLTKYFIHGNRSTNAGELQLSSRKRKPRKVGMKSHMADKEAISFEFIDEPEDEVIHIFQISSVLPKLVDFYCFLQGLGSVAQSQQPRMPHEVPKSLEGELRVQTDLVTEILKNFRQKTLGSDAQLHKNLKKRQDAVRQTGMLALLINTCKLIKEKQQVSDPFARDRLQRSAIPRGSKELSKLPSLTEMTATQQVVMNSLSKVTVALYETLYLCVKGNIASSKELVRFDTFLSKQLGNYRVHVGRILKEIFKYLDISKNSVSHSELWINLLKPVNDVENNFDEQIISLKILAALCSNKGVGVPWFQKYIKERLLSGSVSTSFVQFAMFDQKPHIILSGGEIVPQPDFMKHNPRLDSYVVSVPGSTSTCIALESFQSLSDYSIYLAAFIKLLASIALSRFESAATYTISELGLTFQHCLQAMRCEAAHPQLRGAYAMACRILFVDRNPAQSVCHTRKSCYLVNPNTKQIEDDSVLQDITTLTTTNQPPPELFNPEELELWLETIWSNPILPGFSLPATDYKFFPSTDARTQVGSLEQLIQTDPQQEAFVITKPVRGSKLKSFILFVSELLHLSQAMLEFKYSDYMYLSKMLDMIMNLINLSRYPEFSNKSHWSYQLREKRTQHEFSAYEKLLLACLGVLKVGMTLKHTLQLDTAVQAFLESIRLGKLLNAEVFLTSLVPKASSQEQADEPANLRQVRPMSSLSSIDVMLLFLLFHNGDKRIKKRSLELIICTFDQRRILVSQLEDTVLLARIDLRGAYKTFVDEIKSISYYLKDLRLIGHLALVQRSSIRSDPEFQMCRDAIETSLTNLKDLIVYSSLLPLHTSQLIMKSLGLDNELLSLLTDRWYWIRIEEAGLKKIDPVMLDLYELAVSILTLFCHRNLKHKQLMFPHLRALVAYIENPIKITKLVGEVLSCSRNSEITFRIIKDILVQMNNRVNLMESEQDLHMIFSLVLDEDGTLYPVNQSNVIKALMNCTELVNKIGVHINDIDSIHPHETKYWSLILKLLALLSNNNPFATYQCRRILPFGSLVRETKKALGRFRLKQYYLHALYYVHCFETMDIQPTATIDKLDDVLFKVVLTDLGAYSTYLKYLDSVAKTGAYKVCKTKENASDPNRVENTTSILLAMVAVDSRQDKLNLTHNQVAALDYFKYITSWSDDKPPMCSGLLNFIRDVASTADLPETTVEILFSVQGELLAFYDDLNALSRTSSIDYERFLRELADTIICIPSGEPGEEHLRAYQAVEDTLLQVITSHNKSLNAFAQELGDSTIVPQTTFFRVASKYLCGSISATEVLNAMLMMEKRDDLVNVEKLLQGLKDQLGRLPVQISGVEPQMAFHSEVVASDPQTGLNNFIVQLRKCIAATDKYAELRILVEKLKVTLLDEELNKAESLNMKQFFLSLSKAFNKDEHKIYLIQIFRYMILLEHEKEQLNERASEAEGARAIKRVTPKSLKMLFNLYVDNKVLDTALSLIRKSEEEELSEASLELLISFLEASSRETLIRGKVLEAMNNESVHEVLLYFQFKIREARDLLFAVRKATKSLLKQNSNGVYELTLDQAKKLRQTTRILVFIQLCCDSCYRPFQDFFRVQEDATLVSINIVDELGNFLMNMPQLVALHDSTKPTPVTDLVKQCFKTLTDFCQGPCPQNQNLVGLKKGVYTFLSWLFSKTDYSFNMMWPWFGLCNEGIKFLLSLVESCSNTKIPNLMSQTIPSSQLIEHTECIWKGVIKNREEVVFQDSDDAQLTLLCCVLSDKTFTPTERTVVELSFNIYIFMLYIRRLADSNISSVDGLGESESEVVDTDKMMKIDIYTERNTIYASVKHLCKLLYERCTRGPTPDPVMDKIAARKFFSSCIASVEISKDGSVSLLYFRVPAMMKYLTQKSRNQIALKVYRNTYHERIEELVERSHRYEREMAYQQRLSHWPCLDKITSKWQSYSNYSFLLVVLLNLMILFSVQHVSGQTGEWEYLNEEISLVIAVLSIIQVIFASLLFICYLVEYYPVVLYKHLTATRHKQLKKYEGESFARIKGMTLMREIIARTKEKHQRKRLTILSYITVVFKDLRCFYYLCYMLISIVSLFWPLYYSVLLLDLVDRSPLLTNVLKSVTLNSYQLLVTFYLSVVLTYLFGFIGFMFYDSHFISSDFDPDLDPDVNTYCDTLFTCSLSTTVTGVRAGGGLGEWMLQIGEDDTAEYYTRMIYDFLYFIVIIIIVLNIIFGIIIDTFAQLRDERNIKERVMKESCFVCDQNKFQFELRRIQWKYHTEIEHNITAYLALLIYIRNKPIQECNGLEKFVKESLEHAEYGFFPDTALSLQTPKTHTS